MNISKSSFRYTATVLEKGLAANDVSVKAAALEDPREPSLAGTAPVIRFWRDHMILIPASREACQVKWCSFLVGDVVCRAVRPGDRIEAARDVFDHVAVSVFRENHLVVAVGGLAMEPLGPTVVVTPNGKSGLDKRFQVQVGDAQCDLGARESATLGNYDVYVDRIDRPSVVSIAAIEDPITFNSARRSAVLMGIDNDSFVYSLRGEHLDGTFIRTEGEIP